MPIIDTSVIIEMINAKGKCHAEANIIKREIDNGRLIGYIPFPNLSEVYYIAYSIYSYLGLDSQKAKKLIQWLFYHENIKIHPLNLDLIFLTGDIKNKYHISIMDSFNFALAKLLNEKLIFKSKEMEFSDKLLNDFEIIFIEQI
ncbi:MAG: type II toxin-antitoxin system VapC family toxin [Candidatus Helarchaeota archaeon]